jgi:enamine deaminase RidA (YjgF/YER057c/UK114 family)
VIDPRHLLPPPLAGGFFLVVALDPASHGPDNNSVQSVTREPLSTKEPPMPSKPETRLQELHLTLPPAPKPVAKYKTAVLVGNMLYVSGHGPAKVDADSPVAGKVGTELTLERGKLAARLVGLNILATVRETLGSLDKVKRLVKTLGMVNCPPDYREQPQVINGFSELMADVFGEDAGVGARSAVGMGSLPMNIPVEIECIFEV